MKKLTTLLIAALVSLSAFAQAEQTTENGISGLDKELNKLEFMMENELPNIYVGKYSMDDMGIKVFQNGQYVPVKGDVKIVFAYWDNALKAYGLSHEEFESLTEMALKNAMEYKNYNSSVETMGSYEVEMYNDLVNGVSNFFFNYRIPVDKVSANVDLENDNTKVTF
tara:strand:- start:4034 stop:4534 length:501 start_codon:yes stop_codon:yes gene_type:complete